MNNVLHILRSTNWVAVSLVIGTLWLLLVRVYYHAKPSLPGWVRLALRRWLANRQRKSCGGTWPILESAGVPPQGWPGWPDQHRFALVLTHDVESQTGLDRVRQLAELEMSLGFRSSFNFIPEGSYQVSAELRNWLTDHGFEVGVHDHRHDGKLYNSRKQFTASVTRINHFLEEWKATGFRSGFMLHKLEWIGELNIQYDMSTFDTDPFEPQPDGVKTIFPFWVERAGGGGYVELPYTLAQDSTLFVILKQPSADIWRQKSDWIAARGGMALLNVHPDYTAFDNQRPGRSEFSVSLYTEFLKWLKQKYAGQYWHALPKNVAAFYRNEARRAGRVLMQIFILSSGEFLSLLAAA